MKRILNESGNDSSGTMGRKSWPSAPSPCNQMTQLSGLIPVSITMGVSSDFKGHIFIQKIECTGLKQEIHLFIYFSSGPIN
jgi:hypothetical protein